MRLSPGCLAPRAYEKEIAFVLISGWCVQAYARLSATDVGLLLNSRNSVSRQLMLRFVTGKVGLRAAIIYKLVFWHLCASPQENVGLYKVRHASSGLDQVLGSVFRFRLLPSSWPEGSG